MLDFRPNLDRQFVELCTPAAWGQMCERFATFIKDTGVDPSLQASDFLDLRAPPTEAACARIRATADFLAENANRSIVRLQQILPRTLPPGIYKLTVGLLPFGRYNFGPREGLQIVIRPAILTP